MGRGSSYIGAIRLVGICTARGRCLRAFLTPPTWDRRAVKAAAWDRALFPSNPGMSIANPGALGNYWRALAGYGAMAIITQHLAILQARLAFKRAFLVVVIVEMAGMQAPRATLAIAAAPHPGGQLDGLREFLAFHVPDASGMSRHATYWE